MEIKHKAEVTKLEKENQDIKKEMEEGKSGLEKMGEKLKEEEQNIEREIEERLKTERQNIEREMEEKLKIERQNIKKEMEEMKAQIIEELTGKVSKSSQKTSTGQHQSAQAFDAKSDQPKKPNVQATSDYTSQQQESNAQTANDSNMPPISRSRSPSLSGSSSSSNGSHPGPSSKLSDVQSMLRSQSLSSLHSNDSDIEVVSRSQCR